MNQSPKLFEDKNVIHAKEAELKDLVSYVLEKAKSLGATEAEIGASWYQGLSVNVRMGDVETLEFNRDQGFAVTVFFNQSKGSASTNDFSKTALDDAVKAACNIAKFTSPDPYAGLADANLIANNFPELDLYHPWPISTEDAIELAQCSENAAREHEKITNSDGASLSSHQGCRVYGNSHQFIGSQIGTRHSMSCMVLAKQGDEMQRDYWYDSARDYSDLLPPQEIGAICAKRTASRLGVKPLNTQHAPVLFSAPIASGLINHLISAISGSNLYKNASFLNKHLHKQILPEEISIVENPHLRKGHGSANFDSEGVATYKKYFIHNGVLDSYLLGSYSARKLAMKSTGNAGGVHNVLVEATNLISFDNLCKHMHKGFIVTELMGHGINIVTGDYSRGAAGFWVENGEVQYPVQGVTIAGNLAEMFKQITAVGSDVDYRGNIQTGSILIDSMAIAGN